MSGCGAPGRGTGRNSASETPRADRVEVEQPIDREPGDRPFAPDRERQRTAARATRRARARRARTPAMPSTAPAIRCARTGTRATRGGRRRRPRGRARATRARSESIGPSLRLTTKCQNSAASTASFTASATTILRGVTSEWWPRARQRASQRRIERRDEPRDRPRQRDRGERGEHREHRLGERHGERLERRLAGEHPRALEHRPRERRAAEHHDADPACEPRRSAAVLDEPELLGLPRPPQPRGSRRSRRAARAGRPARRSRRPPRRRSTASIPAPSNAPAASAPPHAAAALGASQRAADRNQDFTCRELSGSPMHEQGPGLATDPDVRGVECESAVELVLGVELLGAPTPRPIR